MAEVKTKKNDASVTEFLKSIGEDQKRTDSLELLSIMRKITNKKPFMYGSSIVGFGAFKVTYASGHTSNWFQAGFSPRKQALTLYIMDGFENYQMLLNKLGKHKIGKSCLYIKKLADVDLKILSQLISESVCFLKEKNEKDVE